MKVYYPIAVDLYSVYPLPVMPAQQANVGRGAIVTLMANSAALVIEDESVFIYVKKPDGSKVYADCTVDGNQIQIDFTQQMLLVPGTLEVELQMIDSSGDNITTPIFLIQNQRSNIDYAEIISQSEFQALVAALSDVEELKKNGLKGDPGEAATITVGKVTASEPGSDPNVTNTGTETAAILNFTLPRGQAGSMWYYGVTITGTETAGTVFSGSGIESANVLDKYLNTQTGNIYNCTLAGDADAAQWSYIGNIMGPEGQTQIYFGAYSGFPDAGDTEKVYVDNTVSPATIYSWNGSGYVPIGGAAADLSVIAPNYDPESTYIEGQYRFQDGIFYKANQNIDTPEAFTAAHWTETTVGKELESLNSKIPINCLK